MISGSGDIKVKSSRGKASSVEMSIIGGGTIDMTPVDFDYSEINIVGSGDARIGEGSAMDVNIIGSGDVAYNGEPELDTNVMGSGDIRPIH